MTTQDWLQQATQTLTASGIDSARLDCLILLEDVLNTNRTQILAHPDQEITEVEYGKLAGMLTKRCQHVPLAYLRGKAEFYGHNFAITDAVLVPRPESEAMIDLLQDIEPTPQTIIDVGTGSGALACIAKIKIPDADVVAVDISDECLAVAQKNAGAYSLDMSYYQSDLLGAVPPDLLTKTTNCALLCNLPYVPTAYPINKAAAHEPALALFGGPDGLDMYRTLFEQITDYPGITHILCESLQEQHDMLAKIAQRHGWSVQHAQGLVQDFVRVTR